MKHSPRLPACTTADIAAILADLQASASGPTSLRSWVDDCSVPLDRVVATPSLNYVRLAARDEEGAPIVLMLLDDVWERAL